jgi:hypothetical protein
MIKTNFKYRKPLIPLDLNKVDYIVIHHTASKTATPEQIHNWHLERDNGTWAGFAYNEYIKKDGTVYIGRGDNVGAHTRNLNSKTYGICVEGDYSKESEMPDSQFKSLVDRISANWERFPNVKDVVEHNYLQKDTACPGQWFPWTRLQSEILHRTNVFLLKKKGIIADTGYWYTHPDKWVKSLIKNFAKYMRTKGD